jgi:hypothetical protein
MSGFFAIRDGLVVCPSTNSIKLLIRRVSSGSPPSTRIFVLCLFVTLDKLTVGFSGLSHSYSEQDLSQNVGGVQNAQVNAKHFHSWDWDANNKVTFFHPKMDWFASEGLQYSSNFVAQTSGPRSETQSRNLFAVDGGT